MRSCEFVPLVSAPRSLLGDRHDVRCIAIEVFEETRRAAAKHGNGGCLEETARAKRLTGGGKVAKKAAKTNAARILDREKIDYEPLQYSTDDGKIDGVSVAAKIGAPV